MPVDDDSAVEGQPLLDTTGDAEGNTRVIMSTRHQNTYWLARVAIYRAMGLIYLVAFLVSAFQNKAILGENGINAVQYPSSRPTPAFAILGFGDAQLDFVAWLGVLLSSLMAFSIVFSWILPVCLWLLYLSIVNLGSQFIMGYGWEWQVLETGFLVIFICPSISFSRFPKHLPPNFIVLCLLRWLAFRVMLGSGMSKMGLNASGCWRDLTCTETHYQTQPNPDGIAWFMHKLPDPIHHLEVVIVLIAELVIPFAMIVPFRNIRLISGIASVLLQGCIILTGNYAYINWITLVPFLACFDDEFLGHFVSNTTLQKVLDADSAWLQSSPMRLRDSGLTFLGSCDIAPLYSYFDPPNGLHRYSVFARYERTATTVVSFLLAFFILLKSAAPVHELMKPNPWLQFYDDYFFVNAYGVFGFVNKLRYGLALEFTHDGKSWTPLDFPCVPGSTDRMPCYITPYHYRLDWQAWIETTASWETDAAAAFTQDGIPDFMARLLSRILMGDTQAAAQMGTPFSILFGPENQAPKEVRASLYMYSWTGIGDLIHGTWWQRNAPHNAPEPMYLNRAVAQQVVKHVSTLPPTRDWSLFFSISGLAISIMGALEYRFAKQQNFVSQYTSFSLLGTLLLIVTLLNQFRGIPMWQAIWATTLALLPPTVFAKGHQNVRKGLENLRASQEKVAPLFSCYVYAAGAAFFAACFFAALSNLYWRVLALTVISCLVQLFVHSWLAKKYAIDGLSVAVTCITLCLTVSTLKAALFSPPIVT